MLKIAPVNVVVSSLHVTVCQYVKAMLTRVIAGETAEKSTTTCGRIG